jgi:hypothetical protein
MPAVSLTVSDDGACVTLANGEVDCWGSNVDGQYGNGTYGGSSSPVHLPAFDGADQLVRSRVGGCVRRGTALSCWGATALLGNNDNSDFVPRPPSGCE